MHPVVVLVFTITGAAVVNSLDSCHVHSPIQVTTGEAAAAPCVISIQEVKQKTTVCNVDLRCKFNVLHACVGSECTYVLETCHTIQHSAGSIKCVSSTKLLKRAKRAAVEEASTTEMEEHIIVVDGTTPPPETTTTVVRPPRPHSK